MAEICAYCNGELASWQAEHTIDSCAKELHEQVKRLRDDCQDLFMVIAEIADAFGIRDSEPEICRKTVAFARNLKLSHDTNMQEFKRIGKELEPIRQKRDTGEPSRADHKEIRDLISTIRGIKAMADEDIRLARADGTFLWQIEADARAALSENGRRTMLAPDADGGGDSDDSNSPRR